MGWKRLEHALKLIQVMQKTTKGIMGKKKLLNVSINSHFSPGKKTPLISQASPLEF